MSRLLVVSDDNTHVCEIVTDEEGQTVARCPCGAVITDRGHFEDTVRVAEVHVDAEPGPGGVIRW